MNMNIEELLHDTTKPYKNLDYKGIEYTVCKEYDHISRYKRLRQVIHYLEGNDRFISLEVQNHYDCQNVGIEFYVVPVDRENRLDLISYEHLGSASYSWIISYINGIQDGYTVFEGQLLMIPTAISDLFTSGNILSSVAVTSLNLGTE